MRRKSIIGTANWPRSRWQCSQLRNSEMDAVLRRFVQNCFWSSIVHAFSFFAQTRAWEFLEVTAPQNALSMHTKKGTERPVRHKPLEPRASNKIWISSLPFLQSKFVIFLHPALQAATHISECCSERRLLLLFRRLCICRLRVKK